MKSADISTMGKPNLAPSHSIFSTGSTMTSASHGLYNRQGILQRKQKAQSLANVSLQVRKPRNNFI